MAQLRNGLVLLFISATLTAPVAAQPAQDPATSDDEIIVTGRTPEDARLHAETALQRMGVARGHRQAARWLDPVCPTVSGLREDHAELVKDWVLERAADVDVPAGQDDCKPNIKIVFVEDGLDLLQNMRSRHPRYFGQVTGGDRSDLLSTPAPVRCLYTTEHRGKSGDRMTRSNMLTLATGGVDIPIGGGGGEGPMFLPNAGGTRIGAETQRVLLSATIIVDKNEAHGTPLKSVAEHAAFLAFAEMRPADGAHPDSILGLFDEVPVTTWTEMDRSFMKKLYAMPMAKKARHQRRMLVNAMSGK
ncbi:MAG: hypothetical protein AAGD40_02790 [Pseudomonadota bacterium]